MSRYGDVPEGTLLPIDEVLDAVEPLANEARGGWGLRRQDAEKLTLAVFAERCLSAEAELETTKKELAGMKLTVARMKKKDNNLGTL